MLATAMEAEIAVFLEQFAEERLPDGRQRVVRRSRPILTVSAINHNYQGRSGPGQLYLASPLTVAASAFAGKICSYEPAA